MRTPLAQHLARHAAGRDPHRRLARRGPPAAAIVADAVFQLVGQVGMAGAELLGDRRNSRASAGRRCRSAARSACRWSAPRTRRTGCAPGPVPAAGVVKLRLARPAAVQPGLDIRLGQREMRGGQPSTTQPIAGPWLSPQVVTRNRWPKVLCDMAARRALSPRPAWQGEAPPPACGSGVGGRGRRARSFACDPGTDPSPPIPALKGRG